jgi:hypothetical protein
MGNWIKTKKEVLKLKNSDKSKKGVLVLKNLYSNISATYVLSFLKRYGNIKRSFFFQHKIRKLFNWNGKHSSITGIIEFTKKINAKRCSVLIKHILDQTLTDIPFEEVFYLKQTNWKKLVEFLT